MSSSSSSLSGLATCHRSSMPKNVVDTGFAKHIGKNNEHLKLCLREVGSAPYFDAVGFSLGHKLPLITSGKPFSIVYSVEENLWNGKLSLQLQVRDIK